MEHSVGAPAEPDFDVQMLDPVPVSDTNINAEDFEDGVEVEDESTTRREGYLSYFFVRVLPDDQCSDGRFFPERGISPLNTTLVRLIIGSRSADAIPQSVRDSKLHIS